MENIGGGESGVMCCKFMEVGKVEHIFSIFCEGLTIIFVGCGDCPEFLL